MEDATQVPTPRRLSLQPFCLISSHVKSGRHCTPGKKTYKGELVVTFVHLVRAAVPNVPVSFPDPLSSVTQAAAEAFARHDLDPQGP